MEKSSASHEQQEQAWTERKNMGGKKDDVRISVGEQQEQTSNERENDMGGKENDVQTSTERGGKKEDVKSPVRDKKEQPSTQGPSSSTTSASIKLNEKDESLIKRINKKKIKRGKAENDGKSQTKIGKIPSIILRKDIFHKYAKKPREIAIGPVYAGENGLQKTGLKHRLAARFIQNSGKTGKTLLGRFKKQFTDKELKNLFHEKVKRHKLTRMLFVDGCSVLQFIDSYVNNGLEESVEISIAQAELIRHDLFLLENQIPFKALAVLMRLSKKGVELAENMYFFMSINIMAPKMYSFPRFLRNIIRLPTEKKQLFKEDNKGAVPVHLLDLLRLELLFVDSKDSSSIINNNVHQGTDLHKWSFRNVQDLKEVGIKLKPDYSSGLRSVSFSPSLFIFGQLKLPPLIVDESTKQKLLNLVAYEMCPGNNNKNYAVTSYLRLLDSLIDCEQDVKDLRSAHILRNNLSSDKEVADLFNSIGSCLVPHDGYSSVKIDIQKYYERKIASWNAQFWREHCRNPWTILALLTALAAFILTGIQAYYSANPKKEH